MSQKFLRIIYDIISKSQKNINFSSALFLLAKLRNLQNFNKKPKFLNKLYWRKITGNIVTQVKLTIKLGILHDLSEFSYCKNLKDLKISIYYSSLQSVVFSHKFSCWVPLCFVRFRWLRIGRGDRRSCFLECNPRRGQLGARFRNCSLGHFFRIGYTIRAIAFFFHQFPELVGFYEMFSYYEAEKTSKKH